MFNPTFYPLYENSGITLIGDRVKLKSLLILERSPSQVSPYTFFFPASPGSDNQALFWSGTETTFRGIAIADVATLQTSLSAINTTLNSLGTAAFQNSGFFAVANHTHSIATQSLAGFLSNTDKIIIDNLSTTYAPLSHSHTGTLDDNFIINSDAANTGSDRSITLARPNNQSVSYSLILPTNLGTANQGLVISSISGSSANLSWGNSGGGFGGVTSHSTTSVNINLVNGNMVAIALNQNTTITSITGVPVGQGAEFTIIATQDATGSRTLSFPIGTTITGSISPDANSTSIVKVFSFNGGTTWEAIVIKPLPNTESETTLWTPSEISTIAWFDFADASTIFLGSGVSQANNKSNSNNLIQSTASKQPIYTNGLNGLGTITLDGADDVLNFSSVLSTVRFALILCRWTSTNYDYRPIFGDYSAYDWHGDAGNKMFWSTYVSPFILNGVHYINEVETPTNSITKSLGWTLYSFSSTNNVRIGNISCDRNSSFANLEIAEIVILDYIPTQTIRNKLAGYTLHKRALQSLLPVNHPYKNTAP